jgi:hypothetical protein
MPVLLADAITAADARAPAHPGVPIVAYVNTTAAVKAEVDICCTSANAVAAVESLGAPRVIMLPDRYLAAFVAERVKCEIIVWQGACEVHERFSAEDLAPFLNSDVVVLAHPECPEDVQHAADFVGSTTAMANYLTERRPQRALLLTECSMADNITINHPEIHFERPCNLCRYMKMITLEGARRCATVSPRSTSTRRPPRAPSAGAHARALTADAGRRTHTRRRRRGCAPPLRHRAARCSSARTPWAAVPPARSRRGIAAPVGTGDSVNLHVGDTVARLATRRSRRRHARHRVRCRRYRLPRAHRRRLTAMAPPTACTSRPVIAARASARGGDRSGEVITQALWTAVSAAPHVDVLVGWRALDLLATPAGVGGVLVADAQGRLMRIEAREVVLATAGRLFRHTTNGPTPPAMGSRWRSRPARTAALEFVQFHLTALRVDATCCRCSPRRCVAPARISSLPAAGA